ncbi:hypothetical protein [Mucilaginibacter sp. KACC 22063]|uniref:hypothetical protein n=1 Tax=Mucilaginibacter sp. KACC 22063 TaxID=3025666 RepID=UPI00236690BE|nr:hypothetical protein [Mucilaginibacter sp. KACC 22063]WDF55305.1 hypothetical protein PQ461_20440 [Mucilaginibacter sp. KACC 22063]
MKKLSLALVLAFTVASVNVFAADKTDKDKGMKCAPGKSCCKKMTKASAAEKAKCKEMCDKAKKAA